MSETLITAVIILGTLFLFIFLFVLISKRGRNKKLARQKIVLADVTWKNKLDLSEQEIINNSLLAIDKVNFILVYINFRNEKEELTLIDLWQIKSVKVTTDDNSIFEQRKGKSILIDKQVNQLQLEITFADARPKANLTVYQYSDGIQDHVQIKDRAAYWAQLITGLLQELPNSSKPISAYA